MTHDRAQLTLLLEVVDQVGEICLELSPGLAAQQQAIKQQLEALQTTAVSEAEHGEADS